MSRLAKVANVSEIISAISVICAIVLAVLALRSEQMISQKAFTIEFVERGVAERVHKSKLKIFEFITSARYNVGIRSDYDISIYLKKAVSAEWKDGELSLSEAILEIVYFYNNLSSCIDAKVCSFEISKSLTQQEAQSLFCIIGPALDELKRLTRNNGLSEGLRILAEPVDCR